jgi:hypothetical protein
MHSFLISLVALLYNGDLKLHIIFLFYTWPVIGTFVKQLFFQGFRLHNEIRTVIFQLKTYLNVHSYEYFFRKEVIQ